MERAKALNEVESLSRLLRHLEPGAAPIKDLDRDVFALALRTPSPVDPGTSVLYLVPRVVPSARADGERRWLHEHGSMLDPVLQARAVALATVVFPGSWPQRPWRDRRRGSTIRLLSAVDHLWIDRLRVHDERGHVDERKRADLIRRLAGSWSEEEEKQFTEPALSEVDPTDELAKETRASLLRDHPDVPLGGLTVLFGPGGIGKTFFLRRVAHRLGRDAISDPSCGVPILAELPLLLHTDALETWISHAGIRLALADIRALVAEGVILPVLDALDELVRGQAREGSRQFLSQLRQTTEPNGRAVLSSRDYYLNLDPLVQEELRGPNTSFLTIGFFGQVGRRRYVQMRTGLSAQHAARWAQQLEKQAALALGAAPSSDVDALIGHPLFLDAFCALISEVPPDRQAVAAEDFQLTSPDVFGEIVERVLDREHDKALPGWTAKFGEQLTGLWKDPFEAHLQKEVLSRLVLLVASDGGTEATRRQEGDVRFKQLRHGLFTFTSGLPVEAEDEPRTVLQALLREIVGNPSTIAGLSEADAEDLRARALDELAGVYLQHTLADTRPNLPTELVFATRHRAYFDYILADALLEQLQRCLSNLTAGAGVAFVDWCLSHSIFEHGQRSEGPPFASCLDFVLWHRRALSEVAPALEAYLERVGPSASVDFDAILASYAASLALALFLRYPTDGEARVVVNRDIASALDWTLELVSDVVPVISNVVFDRCSFPTLHLADIDLSDVEIRDCDAAELRLADSTWRRVTIEGDIRQIAITGRVNLEGCHIGQGVEHLEIEAGGRLTIRDSEVDARLLERLREWSSGMPHSVELISCREREEPVDEEPPSRGLFFLAKLMSLARKHGHREYGVFGSKLRGLTGTTSNSYHDALRVLLDAGAIELDGEMVYLTKEAEGWRFSGKMRPGLPPYQNVSEYWAPIVADLDKVV